MDKKQRQKIKVMTFENSIFPTANKEIKISLVQNSEKDYRIKLMRGNKLIREKKFRSFGEDAYFELRDIEDLIIKQLNDSTQDLNEGDEK